MTIEIIAVAGLGAFFWLFWLAERAPVLPDDEADPEMIRWRRTAAPPPLPRTPRPRN